VVFLSKQNHELTSQLQQAIQWEPSSFQNGFSSKSNKSLLQPSSPSPVALQFSNSSSSNSNGMSPMTTTASHSPSPSSSSMQPPIRPKKWSSFLPSVTESVPTSAAELETFSSRGTAENGQYSDPNNPFGMKERPLTQKKPADSPVNRVSFAPTAS
jgi:hypothetical protein